jgi:PhnB protein
MLSGYFITLKKPNIMAFLNSYLNFNGNAEEAFNFYKSVFGGEFSSFQRFSDMPAEVPLMEEEGRLIMHVSLPIGHGCELMGSDRPAEYGPGTAGDLYYISIQAESKEEANRLFYGLAAGGQITMPLEDTFWSAYYGMLQDRFGVQWMVNYAYPQQ